MKASRKKPSILVLAKTMPLHDRASGDFRLKEILGILAEEFDVDFLSTTHSALNRSTGRMEYLPRDSIFSLEKLELLDRRYIEDLRAIGVNTLNSAEPVPFTIRPTADYDIRAYLQAKQYDVVWVEFYYLAAQYLSDIRRFQPGAAVVCDSVDLHFRRLARQCNFMESQVSYLVSSRQEKKSARTASHRQRLQEQRRHADFVRDSEIHAYQKCDAVVVVSEDDRDELRRHCPALPILFIPNIHPAPKRSLLAETSWEDRSGCVFVGNFDHSPNVSSAIYLKHEVAPLLEGGDVRFHIVGSSPPKVVRTMGEHGPRHELFTVTGYVKDTLPYLSRARVSVAPILFGAGMNGKIGEALSAGLPVVTTSLGAQGMNLVHGLTCLVADDPAAFAHAIRRLHDDKKLWASLREAGLKHVNGLYSSASLRDSVLSAVRSVLPKIRRATQFNNDSRVKTELRLPPPAFPVAPKNPKFSVIVLAHENWPYTELCLRSLAFAEAANPGLAEYILVDNASRDGTPQFAATIKNLKLVANDRNLGFAGGNNSGIRAARGENIVLLNNDTVVAPEWLVRCARHVHNIPNLGLLGPSTNTESGQAIHGASYNSASELFRFNEKLGEEQGGSWERVRKISGLCLVIPRASLVKIGELDTNFGIGYFEDDDFCLRAEDLGLTIARAKDIYVHHFGSVSFARTAKGRQKSLEEGMARFAFKWGKRGLDHIAREHQETLLRQRRAKSLSC